MDPLRNKSNRSAAVGVGLQLRYLAMLIFISGACLNIVLYFPLVHEVAYVLEE